MGVVGIFSIGLPLLIAGILAIVGIVRDPRARDSFGPWHVAAGLVVGESAPEARLHKAIEQHDEGRLV